MADIKAFKALYYNLDKAGAAETLFTQPYDVIDSQLQEAYYQANPHNIIRLEYGKICDTDDQQQNRYSRAAAAFKDWQEQGILSREQTNCFYPYIQEFKVNGQTFCRSGFLATVKAAGYQDGQVLPHEETISGHKEDRYRLMQAAKANFSPIFGLYADQECQNDAIIKDLAQKQAPIIDFCDEQDVRHRVYCLDDAALVAQIEQNMAAHKIYIADGHHRYETASRFAKDYPGCDYMLIDLVNLYDPGLIVLPTHRLVKNWAAFEPEQFLKQIAAAGFAVKPLADFEQAEQALAATLRKTAAFVLYLQQKYYLLTIERDNALLQAAMPNYSTAYQQLDVSIIHSLVLDAICGIGKEQMAAESNLAYNRDSKATITQADAEGFQFAILMNSTLVEELLAVANAGEKMPQKSTFFYPKIIAGLVINKLD